MNCFKKGILKWNDKNCYGSNSLHSKRKKSCSKIFIIWRQHIIAGKKAAQFSAHGIWGIFVVSFLLWHGALGFFFGLIQRNDPSYSFTMTSKTYRDPRILTRIFTGSFKRKLYTSSQYSNKLRRRVSHCIAENDNFKTCPPK